MFGAKYFLYILKTSLSVLLGAAMLLTLSACDVKSLISAINRPVAKSQSVIVNYNTPKSVQLSASQTQTQSIVTFNIVSPPTHGTLTGTAPNLTYTPANGYTGADTIGFQVVDSDAGTSLASMVNLTVLPAAPVLSYSSASGTVGVPMSITPTLQTNGDSATACSATVTPALPAGLSVSTVPASSASTPAACVISGTPTASASTATYTIQVSNAGGSATATVSITIISLPPVLSYASSTGTPGVVGSPMSVAPSTLTANATSITGCAIQGSSSQTTFNTAGFTLSPTTCIITATPSSTFPPTTFTIVATNSSGLTSTPTTVTLAVNNYPALSYTGSGGTTATVNSPMSITPTTLSAVSGTIQSCGVVNTIAYPNAQSDFTAAGFSFTNGTSCVITGTPTSVLPSETFPVQVFNSAGLSTTALVTLTVNAAKPTIVFPNQTGTIGTPLTLDPTTLLGNGAPITNCTATGTAPTTAGYAAINPTALPAGLTINSTTCEISGTPTGGVLGVYTMTATATNSVGSTTSASFTITISPNCSVTTGFAGGAGTVGSPYQICNSAQVIMMGSNLNSNFQLISNVDMANIAFTPFGTFSGSLTGLSAGNIYAIQNVTINIPGSSSNVAFFSQLTGTVQNLLLQNISVTAPNSSTVGAVVGANANGTISKVCVTGTSSVTGQDYTGGFVGHAEYGYISQSCTFATVSGRTKVGGFTGFTENYNANTIINSYARGTVTGTGTTIGGFAGGASSILYVNYSYATGQVTGTGAAGFLGNTDASANLTGDLYDNQTTGATDASVPGRNTADMQTEAVFHEWGYDFLNVWVMPGGGGYPILQWQFSGTIPSPFAGGAGTSASPYQITTVAQFNNITINSTFASKYYVLMNDIDFSVPSQQATAWVGSNATFTGNFNGNFHTLSNIVITADQTNSFNNVGLFGLASGTIQNLTVQNLSIAAPTSTDVGGILGYSQNANVSKVCVTGTSSVTGQDYTGGFVGRMAYGYVSQSCSYANVTGRNNVGGFTGLSENANADTITNSYARGNVTGTGTNIGGFAGSGSSIFYLTYSYASGHVTGTGAAGFVGGTFDAAGIYTSSLYDSQTTGATDGSVPGRTTVDMQTEAVFHEWGYDFLNVWVMPAANSYPILQWQFSGTIPSPFAGGAGTSASPYQITNVTQFNNITINTTFASKYYILMNDIDFSVPSQQATAWVGSNAVFSGNFNGNFHTLSNIVITADQTNSFNNVGLFGLASGTIQNVTLQNVSITAASSTNVGGVLGYSQNANVSKVCVTGTSSVTGQDYTGGFVGRMAYGYISQSCSYANVTGRNNVGGFTGLSENANADTITNSYARGTVTGTGTNIGGFAGNANSIFYLTYSYASGHVTGTGAAGFVGGTFDAAGIYTSSLYDSQTTGATDGSVPGRTTVDMQTEATYHNWGYDFLNVWVMPAANSYPILQWQFTGSLPTLFSGGSGTSIDPYQIKNVTDFNNITVSPSFSNGKYFILSNSIDLSGQIVAWVGSNSTFTGNFNGNNNTLSNINLISDETSALNKIGLFGTLSGTVQNLNIQNITITAPSSSMVGAITGLFTGGTIQNVVVQNATISAASGTGIGGIIGINQNGTASKVCLTGTSSVTGQDYTGGFVGHMEYGYISQSCTLATVNGRSNVGGFSGYSENYNADTITNSYAQGNVTGTGTNIGGFAGGASSILYMTYSYATGLVTGTGAAGFVGGSTDASAILTGSLFDNQTTGVTDNNVPGRNTADMKTEATYHDWGYDFLNTWIMPTGGGYPILQWQFTGTIPSPFAGGSGTSIDPYQITNVTQYNNITISPGFSTGKYFILMNSIDFSLPTQQAIAITGATPAFNGNLNGNNKTLSNIILTAGQTNSLSTAGVFGTIGGSGTVQNLTLQNVSVTASATTGVGAFVGVMAGGSVSRVSVTGTSSVTGLDDTGGFVGHMEYGTVQQSSTTASVSGRNNVGGFTGFTENYNANTIANSYAQNSVTGSGTNIAGFAGGASSVLTISNCYANNTSVSGVSAAGFLGNTDASANLSNDIYNSSTGPSDTRATGLSTGQMQTSSNYNGTWSATYWNISNGSFPTLK